MFKHKRRTLLVGAALLSAGTAYAQVEMKAQGAVQVQLKNAEKLEGMTGEKLRAALLENLSITAKGDVGVARLYVARVVDGEIADLFASDKFKAFPGDNFFPGDSFFPGDMYFPGEMLFPGEMHFPGEMLYPGKDRKGALVEGAMKAAKLAEVKSGWFIIVIGEGERATASGVMLPAKG